MAEAKRVQRPNGTPHLPTLSTNGHVSVSRASRTLSCPRAKGEQSPLGQRWRHLCAQLVVLPTSHGQRVSQSSTALPHDQAQLSGTFQSLGQPGTFQLVCLPAKVKTQGWLQSLPLARGPQNRLLHPRPGDSRHLRENRSGGWSTCPRGSQSPQEAVPTWPALPGETLT